MSPDGQQVETIPKKIKLTEHAWVDSERLSDLRKERRDLGLPDHVAPFSVLIAAMGHHWHPGCFEAVYEMAKTTADEGYSVTFYQEQDRCYQPYDGLGIMRNLSYMRAIREGYEFLLYVDNDVSPEPDSLLRLLRRCVPVVSPVVVYADGQDHGLSMPKMERGLGLALVSSCVLSFLLFQTAVFFPFATAPFWQDALGADEAYHFAKLAIGGHRPFVDTDTVVTCVSGPHYPLDRSLDRGVADLASFGGIS